jgi:hypothetical protein
LSLSAGNTFAPFDSSEEEIKKAEIIKNNPIEKAWIKDT